MRLNSSIPPGTPPLPFDDAEWFAIVSAVGELGMNAKPNTIDRQIALVARNAILRVVGEQYVSGPMTQRIEQLADEVEARAKTLEPNQSTPESSN